MAPAEKQKKPQEFVNLAQSKESPWIDRMTAIFNVFLDESDGTKTKISVVVKVFTNQQMLFNITDSDRFGSTISAKKVERDPNEMVGFDFMGSDQFDDGGE